MAMNVNNHAEASRAMDRAVRIMNEVSLSNQRPL